MSLNDPKRETVARTIASVLMAKQIRETGQIHPQTLLTELGALSGFAAQMSIRKSVIEPQRFDPESILVEVMTKNGEKYYFSDLLNWILFDNLTEPPYSVWHYVRAVLPDASTAQLPDVAEIVSRAARTVGTRLFGIPRLPREHMPHKMPRAALDDDWRIVRDQLNAAGRGVSGWPYDLAMAAQWQMLTSKDTLSLTLAATIVMEAAIPMSKVDPHTVRGA
jgi:hypothetical protein